ncbi:MAG TPA: histidine kinase [Thermoanaerobaculia bacterium]|jgi:signal transduction histidine kinase|nr:histidine kinase [Thermoanaerobaculia bacterium]
MASPVREHHRLLRWGGLAAWLGVGLPIWLQLSAISPGRFFGWLAAWLLFAAAFWVSAERRAGLALLAVQAACVMGLVLLLCDGFEGTLLVLIAMQLASRVSRRTGLAWIAVQSILLAVAIGIHWSPRPAFLLAPPYLGFQILAFFAFEVLEKLERTNAELRSARELLAHSSRVAERLRIARELHDAVGHRLVALSLNLEVASHQTEEKAREPLQVAQSLTRQVLTDIGEIVDTLGRAERLDLRQALEAMTEEIPRPRVHLRLPDGLAVEDAEVAHLLLRCCQEIVTNAAKHAQAENLWLDVIQENGAIEVKARDDGHGADAAEAVAAGRGLAGMRERLESAGGSLEVATRPGMGFSVAALVPVRRGA